MVDKFDDFEDRFSNLLLDRLDRGYVIKNRDRDFDFDYKFEADF